MNTALWLASWYPNKIAPFDGDFIQRHAKATALVQPVHVVHVVKDLQGAVCSRLLIEQHQQTNLTETIIYYKPYTTGWNRLDQLISFFTYYNVYRRYLRNRMKEDKPFIVHVHVVMRAGLLALWLKRNWGIPYVITEHWTGYEKGSRDNYFQKSFFFRRITKKILKYASLLMPVSRYLGEAITLQVQPVPYRVVPNVADTSLFYYSTRHPPVFRFIHVSSMSYQKNIPGLLRVLKKLLQLAGNWQCMMVGPADEDVKKLSEEMGLQQQLVWTGELTYQEVALRMQEASAFVLFSRYETFSCVLIEAACCGLPVIAPRTGGIPEHVTPWAGELVEPDNEEALLRAMQHMMEQYGKYDRKRISERAAGLFNYKKIGQEIADIYKSVSAL